MELIIEQFQDRLHFGAHRELLDLLRLPSLNGPRARALYNAGITTLSELTTADVLVVENALHSAVPFLRFVLLFLLFVDWQYGGAL